MCLQLSQKSLGLLGGGLLIFCSFGIIPEQVIAGFAANVRIQLHDVITGQNPGVADLSDILR